MAVVDALHGDWIGNNTHYYGGKAVSLWRMSKVLKVPDAFVIPVGYSSMLDHLEESIRNRIVDIEVSTGLEFGGTKPLLLSVRSGAAVSCPGMMDTILNVGLNDTTVEHLAKMTSADFAYDCYRRLVQSFAITIFDKPAEQVNSYVDTARKFMGGTLNATVNKAIIKKICTLIDFPQDVHQQLEMSIQAVWKSWNSERAIAYREIERVVARGTAVTIQQMVYGNYNDNSGTGVVFTRNPNTGAKEMYGDFLFNAQGEDIVSGSATPFPLSTIQNRFPELYEELRSACEEIEKLWADACDIEFTIQDGELYFLQARSAKRTSEAGIRIALDLYRENVINISQAELLVREHVAVKEEAEDVEGNCHLGKGIGASPGIVTGLLAFTKEQVDKLADEGHPVIFCTRETSPNDIQAIRKAAGILTMIGGKLSHAAVVARGWNKPCVVGAHGDIMLEVNDTVLHSIILNREFHYKSEVTINGTTGEVTTSE